MNDQPCRRVRLHGEVRVPLEPSDAFELFTPNGEREWAHGWDPRFPAGEIDPLEVGEVFLTDHDGHSSIWAVVNLEQGESITYAVVGPGERSGLVAVSVEPSTGGSCARVAYDLTALSADGQERLDHFAASFGSFLAHWEHSIAHALTNRSLS